MKIRFRKDYYILDRWTDEDEETYEIEEIFEYRGQWYYRRRTGYYSSSMENEYESPIGEWDALSMLLGCFWYWV